MRGDDNPYDELHWLERESRLLCQSGMWDTDCDIETSPQVCQRMCEEICTDLDSAEAVQECLTNDVFLCCTFHFDSAETFWTTQISTQPPGLRAEVTWTNPYVNSSSDWTAIRSAHALVELTVPPEGVCRDTYVAITVKLTEAGTALTYTTLMSFTNQTLLVPVLAPLQAIAPTPADSPIITLSPLIAECQYFAFRAGTKVTTRSSVRYRAPLVCKAVTDCNACVAIGCSHCDWSASTEVSLPPTWIPEWQWIQGAVVNRASLCGVHRSVCTAANGKQAVCTRNVQSSLDSMYILILIASYCLVRIIWYFVFRRKAFKRRGTTTPNTN